MADQIKNSDSKAGFKSFFLPTEERVFIPQDLELKLPEISTLPERLRHFLVYIPWDDKYQERVTPEYKTFFQTVLPYLNARTTNVHVAICLPFIKELLETIDKPLDEKVIYLSFLLHDTGWSQMSEDDVARSLGVTGLTLTSEAVKPKEIHAVLGENIARKVLTEFPFDPPLSDNQKEQIFNIIRDHDKPNKLKGIENVPLEAKLVADVDHLWSFTHENFWQDTIRKGVDPVTYRINLANDLEDYFITKEGKTKAKLLLKEREREVEEWRNYQSQNH